MTIIHTSSKSKKSKPNATQRALDAAWQKLVQGHSKPLEKGLHGKVSATQLPKTKKINKLFILSNEVPTGRETRKIPSRVTPGGETTKKESKQYTGTKMLGVGQMSKSNAVPVFSEESIIDIARMRR